MTELSDQIDYILELDALKHVERRSYITGGERLENSAEHSWHLAMVSWSIGRAFNLGLSEEKLLKLALVHDLGEIDAGDTFLYSTTRNDAHESERECINRLQSHSGNAIDDLAELWEEQEQGNSPEARFLKVIDRLLPFLLNVNSQGKTWIDLGVRRSQVENAHAFIADEFPPIHAWIKSKIELATRSGWLINE